MIHLRPAIAHTVGWLLVCMVTIAALGLAWGVLR